MQICQAEKYFFWDESEKNCQLLLQIKFAVMDLYN